MNLKTVHLWIAGWDLVKKIPRFSRFGAGFKVVPGAVAAGLVFSAIALSAPCSAAAKAGVGLFALHSVHQPGFDPAILQRPYINGVALQIGWAEVEPVEGQYDWSAVDEMLEAARRANKRITIHLMPLHPPDWVFRSGVETYSREIMNPSDRQYGQTVQAYIPWDPIFLNKWGSLVKEFGARYDHNPVVFAVSVTAPLPEMQIPGSFPPGSPSAARVRQIYNRQAYADAWHKMIDAYQEAFPDKPKFVAPGVVIEDAYFADDVMDYASKRFGDNLWAFNAQLRGTVPTRFPAMIHIYSLLSRYSQQANLGFQMIWSASQDAHNQMQGTLQQALANGIQLGAKYIEVYESDILNPSLQNDLIQADNTLIK